MKWFSVNHTEYWKDNLLLSQCSFLIMLVCIRNISMHRLIKQRYVKSTFLASTARPNSKTFTGINKKIFFKRKTTA